MTGVTLKINFETQALQTELARLKRRGSIPAHAGKPFLYQGERYKKRSIPAHAGKPFEAAVAWRSRRVYPHACGETRITLDWVRSHQGLSPRMRGNLPSEAAFLAGQFNAKRPGLSRYVLLLCPMKA